MDDFDAIVHVVPPGDDALNALYQRIPVRGWEFKRRFGPGGRCTCAGPDGPCEECYAAEQLFNEWTQEQRWEDAVAWMAYSRAWPQAMSGSARA